MDNPKVVILFVNPIDIQLQAERVNFLSYVKLAHLVPIEFQTDKIALAVCE
jgi:hypothetical protein